jgi:hypothetical protein
VYNRLWFELKKDRSPVRHFGQFWRIGVLHMEADLRLKELKDKDKDKKQ